MTTLLAQVKALELELHHPGVRYVRKRLEQLLHLDFYEVGRSGRIYSRETVIEHLASQQHQPAVMSDGFAVVNIAADVALLTYRSAHILPDGGLANHALRSSLWVNSAAGWQLRYHQGTPAEQTW